MLEIIAGVAILTVIAFAGYRKTFTRLPIGARLVFLTGTEYILVGFALGPAVMGLLDDGIVRSLTPIFSLGLGLIGLILGIQLEVPKIVRFPASYVRMTLIQAVATMLVVFWPSYVFLRAVVGHAGPEVVLGSFVLASTAGCTAQSALALVSREYRLRGSRVMDFLRFASSMDAVVGLTLFGIAFCLMHRLPLVGIDAAISLQWFLLSLGLGMAMGFLLHLLTRVRCSDEELLVFVTGMVLFSGGVASYFRLSPLFVNLVMGAVATNLKGSKARILNLLARMEKPVYVVFLILAGAIWRPGSAWTLALAGLYLALRLAGKLLGGCMAGLTERPERRPPRTLGLGLVSQGGVVIAMVMSYYRVSSDQVAGVVVTAVLIGVIVSELAGPALARNLLRKAGEIEP